MSAAVAPLAPCSTEFLRNSRAVCMIASDAEPVEIEALVQKVSALSGQPCDWSYVGGRAVVRTTGNWAVAKDRAARCMRVFERELGERGVELDVFWMRSTDQ